MRHKKQKALFAAVGISAAVFFAVQAIGAAKESVIAKVPAYTAALDAGSNRYTRTEKSGTVKNRLKLEDYTRIMEDSAIELWHKEKNCSIRVVDKATGYIWGGLAEEKPKDMNSTWSGVGNALLSIDYFDKKGLEKRVSIADKQVIKKYAVSDNVLRYSVEFPDIGINLEFQMILKDGVLSFKIPEGGISETGEFSLGAVYLVPFLGATREDETDGYMFVPDGPGALIRLGKPSQYLVSFNKAVYGKDYGIENLLEINDLKSRRPNDFATEEPTVLMPVFGMVHGVRQNAFFARIESGEEYASIMATPSGSLTPYNWVSARFIYRQKYLQPTSKSGAGVQIVQKDRNKFDAQITYNFLHESDADYVGMAKLYRSMLKQDGGLPGKERKDKDIPLEMDIIASDIEKGFLFNSVLEITSPAQIKSMVQELAENGITNLAMVVKGWQKGGLNGCKPSEFAFENKLGGKNAIKELSDYLETSGVRCYFAENPVTANETQIDLRKEGGKSLSQALIKMQRDNDSIWFKHTYFIEIGRAAGYVSQKAEEYSRNGMNGMALEEFGSKLYAENQKDNVTTRSEARTKLEKAAEAAASKVQRLGLYTPNQFLWKYGDDVFQVPMVNSQYLFETDTVPFLQIVLKGSVDFFAPYSNKSFYSKMDILKLIEYGAYPSFLITALNNYELEYTPVSELCSTSFEDWKQYIAEIYNEVNSSLSRVEGRMIEDRTVISQGVVKVDYEGGISIIVNYTGSEYKFKGVNIPAQDFAVIEGK